MSFGYCGLCDPILASFHVYVLIYFNLLENCVDLYNGYSTYYRAVVSVSRSRVSCSTLAKVESTKSIQTFCCLTAAAAAATQTDKTQLQSQFAAINTIDYN